MTTIQLRDLRKSFGAFDVIKGIDMDIRSGEFMVFVGPSGCGKSTLLRLICGLEEITGGTLSFDGETVNRLPPAKRGVAMVFQSYALYPHMTVFENMAFGMKLSGADKEQRKKRVEAAAEMLQLTPYLERLPKQLSGGQRQRVAIGRAIVRKPAIFLFDEPLSNLDAALRADMRIELTRLHKQLGATMIYVTHDQIEAMTMADRIVVLNAGYIAQVGAPLELYHKPQNQFVAGFIGNPRMNFLPVRCTGTSATGVTVTFDGQSLTLPVTARPGLEGAELTLGIRPEHIRLGKGDATISITPTVVERLGQNTIGYAKIAGVEENFCVMLPGTQIVEDDKALDVGFAAADCHLFDADGEALERRIDLRGMALPAA